MNERNIHDIRQRLAEWYEGGLSQEEQRHLLADLRAADNLPADLLTDMRVLESLEKASDAVANIPIPADLETRIRGAVADAARRERNAAKARWKKSAWSVACIAAVACVIALICIFALNPTEGLEIKNDGLAKACDTIESIQTVEQNITSQRPTEKSESVKAPDREERQTLAATTSTNTSRSANRKNNNAAKSSYATSPTEIDAETATISEDQMRVFASGMQNFRQGIKTATNECVDNFAHTRSGAVSAVRSSNADMQRVRTNMFNTNDEYIIAL